MTSISTASESSPVWAGSLPRYQWVRVQVPGRPVEGSLIRADAGEVVLRDNQGRVQAFPFHGIEALYVLRLGSRYGAVFGALYGALLGITSGLDELIIDRDPVREVLAQILVVGGTRAVLGAVFGAVFGMLLFGWKQVHPVVRNEE